MSAARIADIPVNPSVRDKRLPLAEAVRRFVPDGSRIALCAALEQMIPVAVGHEIIRQRRRDLTLIGPVSDIVFDQLIGAGCAERVIAAWVGNMMMGSAHNFRRAIEDEVPRAIEMIDHSNLTLALALHAARLGVPFLPTRTVLGSDLAQQAHLREITCPFTQQRLHAVEAIQPDVAILHVQRAEPGGACHAWGTLGLTVDMALSAKRILVVAEEIVAEDQIRRDPNRTLFPGDFVCAVVEEPWGAHPSPVQGFYARDHDAHADYHASTRSREGFTAWLDEWVFGVPDHAAYLAKVGEARLATLQVREHAYSPHIDYGF
jgi:glutaconate CoA-transferase subunit A